MYVTRRPGPRLAPFIEKFWYCEEPAVEHSRERVAAEGRLQILVDLAHDRLPNGDSMLPASFVSGARLDSIVIDTRALHSLFGILFRPGGAAAFFTPPIGELTNADTALAELWGECAGELRERLLAAATVAERFREAERFLLERRSLTEMDWTVQRAVQALEGVPLQRSIAEIAESLGLSRRRFAQRFERRVGLTPKRYARLSRFRRALRFANSGVAIRWTDIAAACGYYDQAHFAHEFRRFSGVNPMTYCERRGLWEAHVRID